ncbi:TetR family transcriptional regulator [Novosphingobium sp.]|uniref:TetR/AcrR family transcriptional regulator n=1 Tax=Novosphingobium sp. TaxID=1874826 RepID=UPI0035B2171A
MADADPRPQRDAARTRAAILAAAQDAFSRTGYSNTGVRDITAAAGVNPALVSRYFGSKEKLYEEALSALLNSSLITDIPRERFGETVVAILTATTRGQRNPLPMMMLASADPTARAITERLLHAVFLEPMERWFGAERGAGKAACFSALASGLTVYRELYPLDAVGPEMAQETRVWLIGAFQSLVD